MNLNIRLSWKKSILIILGVFIIAFLLWDFIPRPLPRSKSFIYITGHEVCVPLGEIYRSDCIAGFRDRQGRFFIRDYRDYTFSLSRPESKYTHKFGGMFSPGEALFDVDSYGSDVVLGTFKVTEINTTLIGWLEESWARLRETLFNPWNIYPEYNDF